MSVRARQAPAGRGLGGLVGGEERTGSDELAEGPRGGGGGGALGQLSEHEQVDGAFTFNTDHYLLEAKWWKKPLEPKELNHFRAIVESKAANTLGLCVAINGFTAGALAKHSERSRLVLMDGADLHAILENRISLPEALERKRRHAVETGNPMYSVIQMLGD
jgi:hypothetical protein